MAAIEIDGQTIRAEAGEMLIAATDRAGIYIPRFCYHEKLSIAANCRMCLVEVQKSPKPLPACATPVTDGMVVRTRSKLAREAQRGTLEFLLINHPLDCPVCDQGGECPLQDQAMGYGGDDSRFHERKRAVASHDIGPLVATEMTRCIHCTRCVRFGEEIAGVMELGFPGRGESAHIATFLNRTVDSEVSGNVIDLCPVGALTSKPYRFAARAWELENHRGISPHDCVGANLNIQTLRGRVERVLPRDNPAVNDCWLADRDRYSYEAVNSERRLTAPMIKQDGEWREVAWETALQCARDGIVKVIGAGRPDHFGAIAGYTATLEEYYLLQKLTRALGTDNVDHRLQQSDFRDDDAAPLFPASEVSVAQFEHLKAALLVGSNLRKEQPLLALRLRQAARKGARIGSITPLDYRQNFAAETLIAGARMTARLAEVAAAAARAGGAPLPPEIARWAQSESPGRPSADEKAITSGIAENLLAAGAHGALILGAGALQHQHAGALKAMAQWICEAAGSRLAILAPGNSAAAWWAGCLPHRRAGGEAVARPGRNARTMFTAPRRAYLLLASEPELDSIDGGAAAGALRGARFVVQLSAYRSDAMLEYADVLLPMAAFTETAGIYLNCEGRVQRAEAAALPPGEARPAWKILRVLGNFLDLPGFDYVSTDDVNAEIPHNAAPVCARMAARPIPEFRAAGNGAARPLERLLDMPMYRGEQTVRNAPALQKTADNPPPAARMNQTMIGELGLADGEPVAVRNDAGVVELPLRADEHIPAGCVYVPAGYAQTAPLGGHGRVTLTKAGEA